MNQLVDIAVTGTGSLATEIMHALALSSGEPLTIALLGRDAERLEVLARTTAARATAVGGRLRVFPIVIDWSNYPMLCRTMAELSPKVLLHTASLQSPWTLAGNDKWARLVKNSGYGFTLPLHAVLALKIGRALNAESPATLFINACYPDAVNRVLWINDVKVSCGLGNVAILAAMFAADAKLDADRRLRMIAHHRHASIGIESSDSTDTPLKAWLDEEPIHDVVTTWLEKAHLPSNMNSIVGASTVPMVLAALGRRLPWHGHSPGPLGLPGGYPVILDSDHIELDLPKQIDLAGSISLNMAAAISDGVTVKESGEVALSDFSVRALNEARVGNIDRLALWHASGVEEQAVELLTLRESFRSQQEN